MRAVRYRVGKRALGKGVRERGLVNVGQCCWSMLLVNVVGQCCWPVLASVGPRADLSALIVGRRSVGVTEPAAGRPVALLVLGRFMAGRQVDRQAGRPLQCTMYNVRYIILGQANQVSCTVIDEPVLPPPRGGGWQPVYGSEDDGGSSTLAASRHAASARRCGVARHDTSLPNATPPFCSTCRARLPRTYLPSSAPSHASVARPSAIEPTPSKL